MPKKKEILDLEAAIREHEALFSQQKAECEQIRLTLLTKQQQMAETQAKLENLQRSRGIIKGEPFQPAVTISPPASQNQRGRPGRKMKEALTVLREHGKPLHLKTIRDLLADRGITVSISSLEGQFLRYKRKGLVIRFEERTYGLAPGNQSS